MLFKENSLSGTIRGHSVVPKKVSTFGLRSMFPKFLRGLGEVHVSKKKNFNDINEQTPLLLKKENIQPATLHIQQTKIKQTIKKYSIVQKNIKNIVNIVPRGLHNIGNTCYMNSTLQCLFHLKYFIPALIQQVQRRQSQGKLSVANQLSLTAKQMQNKGPSLNLGILKKIMGKKKPIFLGYAQQDAQQYLTNLLQILNQQFSRVSKKRQYKQLEGDPLKKSIPQLSDQWWKYYQQLDNSIICDFFQGQTISTIRCRKCSKISVNFDNIWGIPITFHRNSSIYTLLINSWKGQSLVQGYFCSYCKINRDCLKTVELFRFPKTLVIQLKRFQYEHGEKKKRKQEVKIDYQIDLKQILNEHASKSQQTKYRLKGIVHHRGQAEFGHYYAQVYCETLSKWYLLNDSIAQQTTLNLNSRSAYLLFYEQIN